jgi:hypothetical protein
MKNSLYKTLVKIKPLNAHYLHPKKNTEKPKEAESENLKK